MISYIICVYKISLDFFGVWYVPNEIDKQPSCSHDA